MLLKCNIVMLHLSNITMLVKCNDHCACQLKITFIFGSRESNFLQAVNFEGGTFHTILKVAPNTKVS